MGSLVSKSERRMFPFCPALYTMLWSVGSISKAVTRGMRTLGQLSARSTFSSHSAAILVLVPLALSWRARAHRDRPGELPVQLTALALSIALVFMPAQELALTFVPLTFLVWAALRFDIRVVAAELVAFAAVTTYLNARHARVAGVHADTETGRWFYTVDTTGGDS